MRGEVNSKKPSPRKGDGDLSVKIKMKIKENQECKSLSNKVYEDFIEKTF
jgi:hypothetical protein